MRNTNANWQNTVFAVIGTVAFLLAANFSAFAQENADGKYKVGERI